MTGLGYTTVVATEPRTRDYGPNLPLVEICPVSRPEVKWMAFGARNVKQAYELTYIGNNALDSTITGVMDTFKVQIISNFMGLSTAMALAGAWNSRVEDTVDFERQLLKVGYTYGSMIVKVDYILP